MKVAGVHYEVDWRNFRRGTSLFFPTLTPKQTWRKEVSPVLRRLRLNVAYKIVLDPKSGIKGLRVWRL